MAGANNRSGSSRGAGGQAVKLSPAQRNQMAVINAKRSELRVDADAFRRRLPKAMRDGLAVNTVGGAFERMAMRSRSSVANRQGMSRSEEDKYMRVLDASGRGGRGFSGLRIRVDNAGRRSIEATPLAARQMSLAEKAGSRRRR